MEISNTWIRIAGNSKRIKEMNPPPHWRFEISGKSGQYPLHNFSIVGGRPTIENNRAGTRPEARDPEFLAWVAYYVQSMQVTSEGQAYIVLGSPDDAAPYPWDVS